MSGYVARQDLVAAFDQARQRAAGKGRPILAAVAVPIAAPPLPDLFGRWLDAREDAFYWHAHEPERTLCGYGRAATLRAEGETRFVALTHQWRDLLDDAVVSGSRPPLAIGGFRFDEVGPRAAHWHAFPAADLPVPRFTLFHDDQGSHVLWQRLVGADDDPEAAALACLKELDALRIAPMRPVSMPPPSHVTELPIAQWQRKIEQALAGIDAGDFAKVVLAREACQHHTGAIPCADLLRRLEAQAHGAHVFAFARGGACFLGATPERLVRVADAIVHTHALAGSIQRGATETADAALTQTLMDSTKDRHEHALVVDAIVEALAPHSSHRVMGRVPGIKRLPRIQHLCTPIEARLNPGVGVLDIVAALHPTPAVAGLPREAALDHIRDHEGFDRGWYAAPVGWIDGRGNGDFLVALRSALLAGPDCRLYAGCGIVKGSDPTAEFQETCLKLAQMREALLPTATTTAPPAIQAAAAG